MFNFFWKNILKRNNEDEINVINEKTLMHLRRIENVVLVDVRSIQEYNEGHIEGAILLQSFDAERKAERILRDKNAFIVLYCSSGIRSKKVAKILIKKGYKNVNILEQ